MEYLQADYHTPDDAEIEIEIEGEAENETEAEPEDKLWSRLIVDVPLEARLSHIDPLEYAGAPERIAHELFRPLGTNDKWFYRAVKEVKMKPRDKIVDGRLVSVYPPYAMAVLKEEHDWRNYYRSLPYFISAQRIADISGRPYNWTVAKLEERQIQFYTRTTRDGKTHKRYSKEVLMHLRQMNLSTPADQDWLTVEQIAETTGRTKQPVTRLLADSGLTPEIRRSTSDGLERLHYPPEALDLAVEEIGKIGLKPGGDWLTVGMICVVVGRSNPWVRRRLLELGAIPEKRLDDISNPRFHYHPEVVSELIERSKIENEIPLAGDHISPYALSQAIGVSTLQIIRILDQLGFKSEQRKDNGRRIGEYYPPDVLKYLEAATADRITRAQERVVLKADQDLLFAASSLRAKLKARGNMLCLLYSVGETEDNNQAIQLKAEIDAIRTELEEILAA